MIILKKIKLLISILLILNLNCYKKSGSMSDNIITVEGVAEVSKAGLVIAGVMLLDYPDKEKYEGKYVKAAGIINKDHQFKLKVYKKGEPVNQGFDMPIMTKIHSFEIIEK